MRAPADFFARDALDVARDLIGAELVSGPIVLRITEVEAYRKGGDTANHCRFGKTDRNAAMFGPPGHAYIYLCYGMHWMLNLVTDEEGVGAAVLVRSAEIVAGHDLVFARRKMAPTTTKGLAQLVAGPGKVGQALGLDRSFDRHPVYRSGPLELHLTSSPPSVLLAGPRVGIDYASSEHRDAPWRIAAADSRAVTVPKTLIPLGRSVR